MTIDNIKAAVAAIDAQRNDNEGAHRAEDELRDNFIRYIAEHGPPKFKAKAKAVLKTSNFTFTRWYA